MIASRSEEPAAHFCGVFFFFSSFSIHIPCLVVLIMVARKPPVYMIEKGVAAIAFNQLSAQICAKRLRTYCFASLLDNDAAGIPPSVLDRVSVQI